MVSKEVFTFALEVELDDVEAAQQFNEQWDSRSGAMDRPEASPPDERELASRASVRLIAQAFASRHKETGLNL